MLINDIRRPSTDFTGIYKIKVSNNKVQAIEIQKFLSEHMYVFRISKPFTQNKNKYIYAVTSDEMAIEMMFENEMVTKNIPFWKSIPIIQIADKNMLDRLFAKNKQIKGKECWVG